MEIISVCVLQEKTGIDADRFFFGKNRVMAKALGETQEQEYHNNLSTLAQKLTGNVGLLFSNEAPEKVKR